MKKQNVNNKLAFNKAAVTELNDAMLVDVNGGATPLVISWAAVEGFALSVGLYLATKELLKD
ncbi:class I lanthipeptide [Flavobacterium amniphilum]|nr:class I lanthipeptide [Flavobacterium amniphilum]MCL9807124.1 class I lanthipeptide [Flavobacterium amniphilum]